LVESATKNILIVEDDLILSYVLEKYLNDLEHQVVGTVETGEQAITKARELKPDIILMDIKLMGQTDGIEAVREIRRFLDVPVIYITGNSDPFNKSRAEELGFHDYLIKPITMTDLKSSLERLISNGSGSNGNGTYH
jgi:CheY-like chemotaxis protein